MNLPGGGGGLPPQLPPSSSPPPPPSAADRWRPRLALLVVALYVGIPAWLGAQHADGDPTLLPSTVRGILATCVAELGLFGVVFGAGVWLGRLRRDDLWLRWRGPWVIPRALGWSLVLRLAVGMVLGTGLVVWQALTNATPERLEQFRPKIEAMVDVQALNDPVYLALMLTVVSFGLAGLREELWRAGMLALLGRVAPAWFGGRFGPWLALVPVALLFGLAHAPQGAFGVAATTLLGLALGAVMLLHRSLWDAVLAHGFFNAATFALLPWLAARLPDLAR